MTAPVKSYTAANLFCGCGGSVSCVPENVTIKAACDTMPTAVDLYNLNLPARHARAKVGQADSLKVSAPHVVVATPTCKDLNKVLSTRKLTGTPATNNHFPELWRTLERWHPNFVLLDLPVQLLKSTNATALQAILNCLHTALGYTVHCSVVDAFQFGVPQRRSVLLATGVSGDTQPWRIPNGSIMLTTANNVAACLRPAPQHDTRPLFKPITPERLEALTKQLGVTGSLVWDYTPLALQTPSRRVGTHWATWPAYRVIAIDNEYGIADLRLIARLQGIPDRYIWTGVPRTSAMHHICACTPPQVINAVLNTLGELNHEA